MIGKIIVNRHECFLGENYWGQPRCSDGELQGIKFDDQWYAFCPKHFEDIVYLEKYDKVTSINQTEYAVWLIHDY